MLPAKYQPNPLGDSGEEVIECFFFIYIRALWPS